jgi:radical SAM superfamily enzyme
MKKKETPTKKSKLTSLQKKLRKARQNKEQIYREMEEDANDPEVQAYYKDPKNTFDDVQDLMDDY